MSQCLNKIISHLIEADEEVNPREFEIWRGMAAGSQAQGSWQNTKGDRVEGLVKSIVLRRLRERHLIADEASEGTQFLLTDGRTVVFAAEPDIAFRDGVAILAAVEIKGGIDTAGVLERVGAAIKSLARVKESSSRSVTVLVLPKVSVTEQAVTDLETNKDAVNRWFTVEQILDDADKREGFFKLLNC